MRPTLRMFATPIQHSRPPLHAAVKMIQHSDRTRIRITIQFFLNCLYGVLPLIRCDKILPTKKCAECSGWAVVVVVVV